LLPDLVTPDDLVAGQYESTGRVAGTWLNGSTQALAAPIAVACYITAAMLWLIPDRRITRVIDQRGVNQ
jgi:hypothetical protein